MSALNSLDSVDSQAPPFAAAEAALLDLVRDAILVRDPTSDRVTYWNRGAEEMYGWAAGEALGRAAHDLLRTTFPEPLPAIRAATLREGRWEGELVHTRRDGTPVVVASRWTLRRATTDAPAVILEIGTDVARPCAYAPPLGRGEHRRPQRALRRGQPRHKRLHRRGRGLESRDDRVADRRDGHPLDEPEDILAAQRAGRRRRRHTAHIGRQVDHGEGTGRIDRDG